MTEESTTGSVPGFRRVPRTGVIYVMSKAAEHGYGTDGRHWISLGQGSPEVGPLEGAPERMDLLTLDPRQFGYGPVDGAVQLREAVARFYNQIYRRGCQSQYTADNVCIAPGGRAAMARVVAALGRSNLGHFIPDYTAYEELLSTFRGFIPIPILVDPARRQRATAQELRAEILGLGLSSVLCSNPCNPTGQLVAGERLREWVQVARETQCSLIFDEFYSHYIYDSPGGVGDGHGQSQLAHASGMVSAAEFVDDVNADPIVLVDGLTKNWRYPGWRVSWIVGPREVIQQVTSAGSYLDGGANHPFQEAVIPLLETDHAMAETAAIQSVFTKKRRFLIERLRSIGVKVEHEPGGAFYVWGNLEDLPGPLSDGRAFFERALDYQVITVPGVFFDVNPGQRRSNARYNSYTRFSFGPSRADLEEGLDRLERLVRSV